MDAPAILPRVCIGQGYLLSLGCEGSPKLLADLRARKRSIADVEDAPTGGALGTLRVC